MVVLAVWSGSAAGDEGTSGCFQGPWDARIIPAFKNGAPIGFKLFSIRPGSFYAQTGLRNGDLLRRINGYELTSPEAVLVIYAKLRGATALDLDVEREGRLLHLTWRAPYGEELPSVLTRPAPLPTTQPWELVGVLLAEEPAARAAVIRNTQTGKSRTVRERQLLGELRIEHIASGRVLIELRDRLEVVLPQAGQGAWTERRSSPPPR